MTEKELRVAKLFGYSQKAFKNIKNANGKIKNRYYAMMLLDTMMQRAEKLSEFTQIVSNRFSTNSPVDDLIKLTEEYYEYFRKRPLPKTREQFETRATLFQYLVDMEEFIRIKAKYIENISE